MPADGGRITMRGAERPAGPRRLLAFALALDAVWVAAYAALALAGAHGSKLYSAFDLNGEANPPTWWSSAKLLLIGVILIVLAVRPLADDERLTRIRPALRLLGAAFVFLSADEAGVIHERITGMLARLPFVPSIDGNGVWVFLYGLAGLALLVQLRAQLATAWREWRRELVVVAAGAALFLTGGVVFEVLGYLWRPAAALAELEVAFEEGCELAGQSIILYAAASMLSSAVAVRLAGAASEPEDGARDLAEGA